MKLCRFVLNQDGPPTVWELGCASHVLQKTRARKGPYQCSRTRKSYLPQPGSPSTPGGYTSTCTWNLGEVRYVPRAYLALVCAFLPMRSRA